MTAKRRPNFSTAEQSALIESIGSHPEVLQKFHGPGLSKSQKEESWQSIQVELSNIFGISRTVEELKKKWADLKSVAKKEVSRYRREVKKTGGGTPPPPPDQLHEKIVKIIGEEAVEGVVGGLDTSDDLHSSTAGQGDHSGVNSQPSGDSQPSSSVLKQSGSEKRKRKADTGSVAVEMLKTQNSILEALQDLANIQRRSVFLQGRLLALEEYKTYGHIVTEPSSDEQL